jgi:hypothetical protein
MKNKSSKTIEEFFLESLLKLSLAGILIVITVDLYFNRFNVMRSVVVNSSILFAIVSAFTLYRLGYFRFAVLFIGFVIMAAMFYQSIEAEMITTSSMAVVMVIGFGFSVLLKGRLPYLLHVITLIGMTTVFTLLTMHPARYGQTNSSNIIIAGVTYIILYGIIAYSSMILRKRYDDAYESLALVNQELIEKTNEIETQNEELVQSQENLFELNTHLESLVEERTHRVKQQNEQLIKYAYANAHHVRGPVARALGLINLSRLDNHDDYTFLFQKIEEQIKEIDRVIKLINKELESESFKNENIG